MFKNKIKNEGQQTETFDQSFKNLLGQGQEQEALNVLVTELKNTSERLEQWQNVMALLGAELQDEEDEKTKAKEEETQTEDAPYRALAKGLNKQR